MKLQWVSSKNQSEEFWSAECGRLTLSVYFDPIDVDNDCEGYWWSIDEMDTEDRPLFPSKEEAMEAAESEALLIAKSILAALA